MKSIGEALDEHRGVGPGFDAMRVILASGVIIWHAWPVTTGEKLIPQQGFAWAIVYVIVPMFFALSGFLVTASATRLSLSRFAVNRALRILPALAVDTSVSILIFGAAFTTLPLWTFLTHPATVNYWLNCVGEIHYWLPGVFESNPDTKVNASLWTVPGELFCYAIMAGLIITGLIRKALAALLTILLLVGINIAYRLFGPVFPLELQLAIGIGELACFFLAGSALFSLRYRIPRSANLATLCVAYILAVAMLGSPDTHDHPLFLVGAYASLAYLVVWLGMLRIPLPGPFRTGDYSYGMYLYGYPVQQAVVQVTGTRSPWVVLIVAFPIILLMARLSWVLVETPALRLRRLLPGGSSPVKVLTPTGSHSHRNAK